MSVYMQVARNKHHGLCELLSISKTVWLGAAFWKGVILWPYTEGPVWVPCPQVYQKFRQQLIYMELFLDFDRDSDRREWLPLEAEL